VLFSQPPQGGQSASVPDGLHVNAVSPDGTLLMGLCRDQKVGCSQFVIVSADGRAPAGWFGAPLGQGNFGRAASSPDGKWLALVRGVTARDVVVIKDLSR
jgi:hypothetical protein